MKRPSLTSDRSMSRRKGALSEEEHALWESVAKQVKPLRKKPRHAAPQIVEHSSDKAAAQQTSTPHLPPPPAHRQTKPAAPPLVPLGRRERSRLSRGRSEIDARLDLHGMTLARAHRALLAFLARAHHDGLTFVLVITGKGRAGGSETERGVLRRHVPEWLSRSEFRALVVGFEQAHIGHGGEGALYVRVRRARA
ncbi:MAG: Smr/MutS family protein [Bradyrhizobium sp.]